MLSETEENYLKIMYKLEIEENKKITTNLMADTTQTKPASVTEMLKRLAKKEMITYKAYKGVELTNKGKKIGQKLTRNHRLWETFLVNNLGFNWEEIHEIAEELEHIKSEKLLSKIDELLNHPKFDPHGEPIPSVSGLTLPNQLVKLSEMKPSTKGIIAGIKETSGEIIDQLNKYKLFPNKIIKILDTSIYDGSLRVEISGEIIQIPKNLASIVLISRTKFMFKLF